MSISSVGNHPYTGAVMDLPATKERHVHRLNSEAIAAEPSVKANAGDESVTRAERHDHHGHDRHHGHHGNRGHGFGFGRYGMGMGHAIHEQMRAARREVASEQVGEAVADLTTKVAEVIGAAGQLDGMDTAQENFTAAVQDVVDRFDSGEIGRRGAMAGFRAAFEDLADAVRSGSADETPVAEKLCRSTLAPRMPASYLTARQIRLQARRRTGRADPWSKTLARFSIRSCRV